MGLAPVKNLRYYNPFWITASAWVVQSDVGGLGLGSGVTFVTTPAHPLDTSLGETVVRLTNGTLTLTQVFGDYVSQVPPDNTRRWGGRHSFLLYIHTAPTSDAPLYGAGGATPNNFDLYLTTDRKLKLLAYDNVSATYTMAGSDVLSTGVWYQIEVWTIWCAPTTPFATLSSVQYVVRIVSNITTTRDVTTTINDASSVPFNATIGYPFQLRMTADGVVLVANLMVAIEDANDPWGIIRGDRLDPNGTGALAEWVDNQSGDVDESGTVVPDDATTVDQDAVAAGLTHRNLYTLTSPGHATSADSIIGVVGSYRWNTSAAGKGQSNTTRGLLSDGTTHVNVISEVGGSSIWRAYSAGRVTKPSGGAWAHADLVSLQTGISCFSDFSSTNISGSTVTTLVAYQKSGETTAPVADPPVAGQHRGAFV